MAKDIGPGSLVRCVDNSQMTGDCVSPLPVLHHIYTVMKLEQPCRNCGYGDRFLILAEIPGSFCARGCRCGHRKKTQFSHDPKDFVPVDDDDIAIFRRLTVPKELADA